MIPQMLTRLSWYTLALAIVAGGLIHLLSTLAVPRFATAGAFQNLANVLPVNRMRVLPPIDATNQPLPFTGPDVRLAICQFDLGDGPLALKVSLPDSGWLLALYTLSGDNFYVLPAQEGRSGEVSLKVHPAGERSFSLLSLSSLNLGGRTKAVSLSQVESPERLGFAVIRAPLRGRAFAGEIEATLKRTSCEIARD